MSDQGMAPDEGDTVDIPEDLWVEYLEARTKAASYDDIAKGLAERIKKEAESAGATKVTVEGEHKATVSPTTTLRFDTKRFKDDWPDIYSQYQVAQKSTRLTVRKEATP